MKAEQVARSIVRMVADLAGVFVILALTATSFDGTELTALALIAIWVVVVEVVVLSSGVRRDRTGRARPIAAASICLGLCLLLVSASFATDSIWRPIEADIVRQRPAGTVLKATVRERPWDDQKNYLGRVADMLKTADQE